MTLSWNHLGVLPPISPNAPGHSSDRSPYIVTIHQLIHMLSYTERRRTILIGMLNYRKALYQAGITRGFQWIDGSFVEDIETLEQRDPNDLDVVTFFYLPQGVNQGEFYKEYRHLIESRQLKEKYQVDGYVCSLGESMEGYHVKQVSYWYSMWSHRRNGVWKGFLQVELSEKEDTVASSILNSKVNYE